jgi:LysM repeat protein
MNKNTGVDSQQEEQRRLEQKIESKIDSMFFKRETDSVHDNVSDNTNDKAYGGACEPKIIYRHIDAEMIPVKKGKAAERNVGNMNDKRCEKPAAAQSGAAHHLPVWKPLKADVVNVEEVPEKATKMTFDERFGNPLGRTANADTEIGADIDVEIGADMIKENARLDEANLVKNTSGKQGAGAVIRSNVPLFDMKSVSASVKENNSEKTENVELDKKVGVKLSEKTGNFELDKKVGVKLSEKTENFELDKKVGVKLSEKTKNLEKIKNAEKESVVENIDAPEINRSKFRSMLTTAAIARLQARGEDLNRLAETAASAASEHEKIAKSAKVVEGRAIEGKSRETVPEGKEADLSPDIVVVGNREVTEVKKMAELEEMPDIVVANAAAKESENVKSVNNVEKPVNNLGEKYVEKPVEKAVENVVENLAENLAEVTSAENIKSASAQGDEPVDEAAAEAENVEVEAVAAGVESEADVVVASVEQIEQAGKIEQVAQNERIEDNEQKGRERQDERVQLVNNNGVRLRMAARNTNDAPTAKTAASQKQGGFCLKYYVVKPGEELMKIALNISPEKLLAANNLSGDEPQAGTVLRIPC